MKLNKRKKYKGFTLIEMLVVVLIIGILAGIALPQYQMAVAKSRVTEAIIAMKTLSSAEEIYYMAQGTYTDVLDSLDVDIPAISNYYDYSCYDAKWLSCIAHPKKDGYPVLEFVFLNHNKHAGKHWCQTYDSDLLTSSGKERAAKLCKTYGSQDLSIGSNYGPYYLIK